MEAQQLEAQHRAVLATVAQIVDPERIAHRDRTELISACRTLADWLRQYVEIAAEQSAEIKRLTAADLLPRESDASVARSSERDSSA